MDETIGDQPLSGITTITPDQQLRLGRIIKDGMLRDIRHEIPSANEVRKLRPQNEWFIDPDCAKTKTDVHGIGHIGRLIVVGIPYIHWLKSHGYSDISEPIIIEALRRHDVRVSSTDNYPDHAKAAVQFFQSRPLPAEIAKIWNPIAYVILRHPDDITNDPVNEGLHLMLYHERRIMQDLDASDLSRPGANVPIYKIRFRMDEASQFGLPYITKLLRVTADSYNTGDAFEDQIQAGIELGMVR